MDKQTHRYGDPEVLRRRVALLRERANDIRGLADRLIGQFDALGWSGRAGGAMRARIRQRAAALRSAADRHDKAADTLHRHADEVTQRQEAIAATERKAAMMESAGEPGSFTPPPPGHKDWLTVELPR